MSSLRFDREKLREHCRLNSILLDYEMVIGEPFAIILRKSVDQGIFAMDDVWARTTSVALDQIRDFVTAVDEVVYPVAPWLSPQGPKPLLSIKKTGRKG